MVEKSVDAYRMQVEEHGHEEHAQHNGRGVGDY